MLRLLGNPKVLCDDISRRDLLHVGGLSAFGLALHHWLLWREAHVSPLLGASKFRQVQSCFLIYKYGIFAFTSSDSRAERA